MYRFTFQGIQVECETADELRAALSLSNGRSASGRKPYKPRKVKRMKAAGRSREGVVASWEAARRVAKRLGRKDIKQVRSDLRAGTVKDE
ncbi:MAG: hypothetical protein ACR2FY_15105 [Pirellulaceae bacterium]